MDAQTWRELSALYEAAQELPASELPAWLARLRATQHPLCPRLEQMLDAGSRAGGDRFLEDLPALSADHDAAGTTWSEGDRVGPYRLLRPLGAGGAAEVWLAERDDARLRRPVALKLPYPGAGRHGFAARFDRERDILASLNHAHIARLYDAGLSDAGQPWLALELVEGEPITRYCDTARLGLEPRVRLFRQVLLAVRHAHANLVIHRDLKPANILVTSSGEVRLLDFGIAKLMEPEGGGVEDTELTRHAGRPMTPTYAAPEQLLGQPLTTACDVYALGVVFYELLCGARPYELKLETAAQIEQAILEIEPRAPSRRGLEAAVAEARRTTPAALRRELAPELDAIALRALGKQPTQRYSSIEALLADVDRWLAGEPVLARGPSRWYRWSKFAARHRLGVGLGVGAVLSLAAVASIAVVLGLQARQESARAGVARDFLLDLFTQADPEHARGASITANELIARGLKRAAGTLQGQPELQAELMHGLGRILGSMGEYSKADAALGEVAARYRHLGLPLQTARAEVDQADAVYRMGDYARADALLARADEAGRGHAGDATFQARLAEVQSWLAFARGDLPRARQSLARALEQFTLAHGELHARSIGVLSQLAFVEGELRDYPAALDHIARAESRASRLPGMDARELAGIRFSRAEIEYGSGNYRAAMQQLSRGGAECDLRVGPNSEDCILFWTELAQVSLRVGRHAQALDLLPKMMLLVRADASPSRQAAALILACRTLVAGGRRDASLEQALVRLGTSGTEVRQPEWMKINALAAQAEGFLREGRAAEALPWLERAWARHGAAPSGDRREIGRLRLLKGVALQQQGRHAAALELMVQAQVDFAAVMGESHVFTLLMGLNQVSSLHALGQTDTARLLLDRALPRLGEAMGEDAPTWQRAARLRAGLGKGSGAGDAAAQASFFY